MPAKLSQALRTLIETKVDSFEKLELVMALRRGQASIAELTTATNLDRDDVRRSVRELTSAGLIAKAKDSDMLQLSAADSGVLDELGDVYEKDKATLAMAIAERAMDRLRNLAGRALADAFVIRKKPGGNDG